MTKLFQIGNDIFEYPQQGTGQGHGEAATAWAEAVTAALAGVQGPNDILLTTQTLGDGESVALPISELSFNLGQVQHVNIEFLISREYLAGGVTSTLLVESGKIFGNYDGTDFRISIETTGDNTGIDISVDPSGQFKYTSSLLETGGDVHVSSLISYKARTIDK